MGEENLSTNDQDEHMTQDSRTGRESMGHRWKEFMFIPRPEKAGSQGTNMTNTMVQIEQEKVGNTTQQ
jgi:hypothetical protein